MPRGQTLTTSASLVANGLLIQEANTSLLFHENRHHHNRIKAAEQTLLHLRAAGQVPIIAVLKKIAVLKMHFLWIYSCCHPDQILCRPHVFMLQQPCPMGPSNQLIKKAFYSKKTWIFVPLPRSRSPHVSKTALIHMYIVPNWITRGQRWKMTLNWLNSAVWNHPKTYLLCILYAARCYRCAKVCTG